MDLLADKQKLHIMEEEKAHLAARLEVASERAQELQLSHKQ